MWTKTSHRALLAALAIGTAPLASLPAFAQTTPPIVPQQGQGGASDGATTDGSAGTTGNSTTTNAPEGTTSDSTAAPDGTTATPSGGTSTEGSASGSASGTQSDTGSSDSTTSPSADTGSGSTSGAGTSSDTSGSQSTDQSGASTSTETNVNVDSQVNITTEQTTEIRQVIQEVKVAPVTDVDFDVTVGVEVPKKIELRPLPPRIIKIVPQYENYRFFVLEDGRIVIVDPKRYVIVYVITA